MKIRRFIRELLCPHRFKIVRAEWPFDSMLYFRRCEFCGKIVE